MGFQGDLDSFGLAAIFQTLTANKQSGTLHVFDKETDRYLVFSKGSIRSVSTGKRQNVSLGEILVARGIIDEMALATALTDQVQTKALLGDTLVQQGACSQGDIDRTLRFQMEEEIYDLFTWRGAHFEFEETPPDESQIGSEMRISQVEVNTGGLVLEAMRRIDEWDRIAKLIPTIHMIPVIPEDRQDEALFLTLSSEEKRIISFMNGVNDVDQITRKSCLGRYSVTQFVSRLLDEGNAREASAEEMLASADNLLIQGALEQAVILQRRILELTPGNIELRRSHADALEALGEKKEAAHNYNQLAESLCGQQSFDEAAEACAKASDLVPEDPETFERLAELYILSDRTREAGSAWVKTIQFLEKEEKKDLAFRKLQEALQDLPEHEDLNRMYARYLLERGEAKESIHIYERLAQLAHDQIDREKEINAYRSILRIDSKRSDIQHKLDLLLTSREERGRKLRNALILAIVAAMVLGLVGYTAHHELSARDRIATAIAEAEGLIRKAADSPIVQQKQALDRATTILNGIAEVQPITGDYESRREALLVKAQQALETIQKDFDRLIASQWGLVKSAKRFHPNYYGSEEAKRAYANLKKLCDYPEKTEPREAARQMLADPVPNIPEKIKGICAIIGNRALSKEKRFKAFEDLQAIQNINMLLQDDDYNLKGITLPTRIEVVSNTGAPLGANIVVNGKTASKQTPAVVELPLDMDLPVLIGRRGYGNEKSLTPLIRKEIKESYRVPIKRRIRWRILLRGAVEKAPVFSPDGKTLYAATNAGEVVAVNTESGKVLWPRSANLVYYDKGIYKSRLQLRNNRLFALTDNGCLTAFAPQRGQPIWPAEIAGSPLLGEVCTGYTVTSIKTLKGEEFRAEQLDVLVAGQNRSPLYLIDAVTGKIRWPATEAKQKALADKIGVGTAAPYHKPGGNIFLLGSDGRLHVLLEDGTYVDGKSVIREPAEGTPLFFSEPGKNTSLLVAEESVGFHCVDILSTGPLAFKKRWTCEAFVDQPLTTPFLLHQGYVYFGFDTKRVARINIQTGRHEKMWDFRGIPGPVAGRLAIEKNRLLVPFSSSTRSGKCGIVALQMNANGFQSNPLWRLDLENSTSTSGIAVTAPQAAISHIAFGDNRTLYILSGEE